MTTHGLSGHKFYSIWCAMLHRCESKNNPAYHNYGKRGISVCSEWHNPSVFIGWLEENGYDLVSPYAHEIDGIFMTQPEIRDKYGILPRTFRARVAMGWNAQRAAMTPVGG